jgi:hypothetical protein
MPAPKEILDLVARFELHLDAYKSGDYNETQLRRDFLDPFFKALGWDVDNTAGYAEAYRDVVLEDSVRISGTLESPDYSFGIGKDRKFFLEAKKPSIDIRDGIPSAYQLRRYAWSAKLPLSILSDFEELAIYDGRIKPAKDDAASTARVFYCTFREYAEKWDWISSVFSRDAVLKGAFDKYAEGTRSKRGTTQVDDDFLSTIEGWREQLARNLALRNPGLTQRELNFAVQRILDRIVFLRIAEDRGIEPYGRLLKLTGIAASQIPQDGRVEEEPPGPMGGPRPMRIYPQLCEIFERADARYNSGLFHFSTEKDRDETPDTLTLHLHLDDVVLKDILVHLYYPNCDYAFAFIPAEILGHVYEQFLGKVIRLTEGHRAVVEEKPEVRKAGGVYYTPTYIVDYIVQQTVGPLIEGKTPNQVEKLHILDPACGSGSFLLGAYEFLLDWHLRYYLEHNPAKWAKGKDPAIYETTPNAHGPGKGSGNWRLTTAERKRILLNNLYGVDIDSQAVEVTKLSLLLKVLEGEAREYRGRQIDFHRVLPDLGKNIKCGNSLIGSDFYQQTELALLDDEEQFRINVFDWGGEDGFTEIMNSGGFDAVIGNPPYGAYLYNEDKSYLTVHYPNQTYQLDTYLIFLEKILRDLIRDNGSYGMIIPNPWLTNLLQTSMRQFVMNNCRVKEIVHFQFPVFPRVVVDTEILLLQKISPVGCQVTVTIASTLDAFLNRPDSPPLRRLVHKQQKWRNLQGGVINIFTNPQEEALANKVKLSGQPLDSFCDINVGIKPYQTGKGSPKQTKKVVKERPFDSSRPITREYRQYLRGIDINRYRIAPTEVRYLRYGPWLAEPRPAANFNSQEKIMMRQTGDSLVAALDRNQLLCLNNMHVLVPQCENLNVCYLLGIINSKLLNWYYHTLNPEVGEALAEVKRTNVAKLPIRNLDLSKKSDQANHDQVVALVERLLQLQHRLPNIRMPHEKTTLERQIAALDQQIDCLVYDLYDLTKAEISIVEKSL